MRAIQRDEIGGPLLLRDVPQSPCGGYDARVAVKASRVQTMRYNSAEQNASSAGQNRLFAAPVPSTVGFDCAGVVTEIGAHVVGISVGDRVYVDGGIGCGTCLVCRRGDELDCPNHAVMGYVGRSADSNRIFRAYGDGSLAESMVAPARNLVKIPDDLDFARATRIGYLAVAYSGLRRVGLKPGEALFINGITGSLGLSAAMCALAMGVRQVFGTARKVDLFERIAALDPRRVHLRAAGDAIPEWVRAGTDGIGADVAIDCLGPGAPASAAMHSVDALRAGGRLMNAGALAEPLPISPFALITRQLTIAGSYWFTTGEAQDIADFIGAALIDMSPIEPTVFPLDNVDGALANVLQRHSGFTITVVCP